MVLPRSADIVTSKSCARVRVEELDGEQAQLDGADDEARAFGPGEYESETCGYGWQSKTHSHSNFAVLSSPASSTVASRSWNAPFMGLWQRHGLSDSLTYASTLYSTDADESDESDAVELTLLHSSRFGKSDLVVQVPSHSEDCRLTSTSFRHGPISACSTQTSFHSFADHSPCEPSPADAREQDAGGPSNSHDVTAGFDEEYEARGSETSDTDTPPLTPMSPRQARYKPRLYVSSPPVEPFEEANHHKSELAAKPTGLAGEMSYLIGRCAYLICAFR